MSTVIMSRFAHIQSNIPFLGRWTQHAPPPCFTLPPAYPIHYSRSSIIGWKTLDPSQAQQLTSINSAMTSPSIRRFNIAQPTSRISRPSTLTKQNQSLIWVRRAKTHQPTNNPQTRRGHPPQPLRTQEQPTQIRIRDRVPLGLRTGEDHPRGCHRGNLRRHHVLSHHLRA